MEKNEMTLTAWEKDVGTQELKTSTYSKLSYI
jgi:hypothetical protein